MVSPLLIQTKKKHGAGITCASPRLRGDGHNGHDSIFGGSKNFPIDWKDPSKLSAKSLLLCMFLLAFIFTLCGVFFSTDRFNFNIAQVLQGRNTAGEPEFVYEEYLRMYPDLGRQIEDEESAERHYFAEGKKEGRLPGLPRIIVQYTACTTFVEQVYSHLAALVIVQELGPAELVLPITYTLDSSGNYTSFDVQSLVDAPALQKIGMKHGITIHQTPGSSLKEYPPVGSENQRDRAFQTFAYDGILEPSIMKFTGIYNGLHDLDALVRTLYEEIGQKGMNAAAAKKRDIKQKWECIVNLPCTFFAINGPSATSQLASAAYSFPFAVAVSQLAAQALLVLANKAASASFNGVVLSGPPDYLALITDDQEQERWAVLASASMEHFSDGPCYLGMETLFDFQDPAVLASASSKLVAATPCTGLLTKYQLLGEELNSIHSEQHKLLDLLVLQRAGKVLGPAASLMTLFLHETRFLHDRQYAVRLVQMPGEKALAALLAEGATFTGPGLSDALLDQLSGESEAEQEAVFEEEDGIIHIVTRDSRNQGS